MIRKISILILVFLTGCSVQRITEVIFIASIGIEKQDDKYVGYFYLPSSEDVGKSNDSGTGVGEYAKIEADNLALLFGKSQSNTELEMDLRHVASLIIDEQLLNNDFITEMLSFFKETTLCDLNFYIFVTSDKIEDIYGFKNPNKESVLNSILVSTTDSSSLFLSSDPIHFLNFCRDYLEGKCIKIPYLVVDKMWNDGKEEVTSFHCTDMVLFSNNNYVIVSDSLGYYLKKNTHFFDKMGECLYEIRNYKCDIRYKDNLNIDVQFNYTFINKDDDINNIIKNKINDYLDLYSIMDPLNIYYHNRLFGTNYSYDNVEINIKCQDY